MTNNLEQVKNLVKMGLNSVAVRMMVKDIHEILEAVPLKSTNTRKHGIKLILNNKTHTVLDVVSTGITTRSITTKDNKKTKHSVHEFFKYEDLNPLQLWLLAYVYIPKLARMEENHESI